MCRRNFEINTFQINTFEIDCSTFSKKMEDYVYHHFCIFQNI